MPLSLKYITSQPVTPFSAAFWQNSSAVSSQKYPLRRKLQSVTFALPAAVPSGAAANSSHNTPPKTANCTIGASGAQQPASAASTGQSSAPQA